MCGETAISRSDGRYHSDGMQLFQAAEPAAALREAYRVLKPEGWLLMSDMYARKKELFLDGMLGRLESAKTICDRMADAGFALVNMQDVSGTLAEWIGQQIFDGNLESVCAALGAERKILKEAGCGYFIAAAQPSGLWRTLSYVKEKSPFYQKKFTSVWGQLGEMAGSDVRSRRIRFHGRISGHFPSQPRRN